MQNDEKMVDSVQELAKPLDVADQTLRRWTYQGKIPAIRIGRLLRFPKEEIDQWLKAQHISPGKR